MINWQPIKAAPKDGTEVLLFNDWGVYVGKWDDDTYCRTPRPFWHYQGMNDQVTVMRKHPPTHWAPINLPEEGEAP
jgi:hypothetical protein